MTYIWPQIIAFVLWLLFGAHEIYVHSIKTDIRVDLLITWPVMLFVSFYAMNMFLKGLLTKLY